MKLYAGLRQAEDGPSISARAVTRRHRSRFNRRSAPGVKPRSGCFDVLPCVPNPVGINTGQQFGVILPRHKAVFGSCTDDLQYFDSAGNGWRQASVRLYRSAFNNGG